MPYDHPGCSNRLRARQVACTSQITDQAQCACSTHGAAIEVPLLDMRQSSAAAQPGAAGTPWASEVDVRAPTPSPPRSSPAVERTSQPPHISRQQCSMAHALWRPIAHVAVLCAARAGVADTSGPTSSVMAAT
eukprot:CAMPEP_0119406966 /NCGR_PEP_ID=MMETSP1335-20130426/1078_1 /TAXON_ID=259385 /ORGANISM="Chrysoculter rhomboideus, Strain RCC1486" /LENGTH=132 /DNA_ID=CAMNT_0007431059 /DNA_START=209 /DNA_END=605 /DNA_ORIENTATION=+